MKKYLTDAGVALVVGYLNQNIFVHEEEYLFYKRQLVFNLDVDSNSGHEATHQGVKYGNDAISPRDRLDRATKKLVDHDQHNLEDQLLEAKRDYYSDKLSTQRFKGCTKFGAGILESDSLRVADYISDHAGGLELSLWYVMFHPQDRCEFENLPQLSSSVPLPRSHKRYTETVPPDQKLLQHPNYRHVHILTITSLYPGGPKFLLCSCGGFERTGLICVHMQHVAKYYLEPAGMVPWNYRDCNFIWSSAYNYIMRCDPAILDADLLKLW